MRLDRLRCAAQRLREIFVIPDQYGRFPNEIPPEESQAGGGEGEGEAGAPPPPKYRAGFGPVEVPSEGLHCGPTLSGGRVPPERVLPLDMGSELAVAEAALQARCLPPLPPLPSSPPTHNLP